MKQLPYMTEEWFRLLCGEIARSSVQAVATRLDVSRGAVSQVLNGSGLYGTGRASTAKIAARVRGMFVANIVCPFLTAFAGSPKHITPSQCNEFAYREPPTANPHDGRHWRACRTCHERQCAPAGWDESQGHFVVDLTALTAPKRRGRPSKSAVPKPEPEVAASDPDVPPTFEEAAA